METLEINVDGSPLVAPRDGYVLMVRFKLQDRSESDTVFCDYASRTGTSIQFVGCRCKTFIVGYMPCDHAVKVGSMSLDCNRIVDVSQLPTPPWYYRLEEDARALTQGKRLALEVGVLDIFSELTGAIP
jgi:hypothetical protein